jgi:hypothetical protein
MDTKKALGYPMNMLGYKDDDNLIKGGFGAVLARAGVGKSEFLANIALNAMLKSKNVLHITLDESVKKVCLWYDELLKNLKDAESEIEPKLSRRFIMTFKKDMFSFSIFEERYAELTEQGIFNPQLIIIDGLDFDEDSKKFLYDLKDFAENADVYIWFAALTHRSEETDSNGLSIQFASMSDMFESIIRLEPSGKEIDINVLKTSADIPLDKKIVFKTL